MFGTPNSNVPEQVPKFLTTLVLAGLSMPAAERLGQLKADPERSGRRLADADLMIASIALTSGAILITGNRRHYNRIEDLQIEDWIRG